MADPQQNGAVTFKPGEAQNEEDYQHAQKLAAPAAPAKPGFLDRFDEGVTNFLAPNPKNYSSVARTQIEVPKTLGRELYAGGKSIVGMPGAIYHSFADAPTAEEKNRYADFERQNGEMPGAETSGAKRIGLGLDRMLVRPVANAVEDYSSGKVTPESALSVAPEAIGQSAGQVVLAKGIQEASPYISSAVKSALPPVIRGGAKVINLATQKLPEVAGGAIGAGAGEMIAGPKGAAIGGAGGAALGRGLRGVIPPVPGEDYGLTTMQKLGVENPDVLRYTDQYKMPAVRPSAPTVPMKTPFELGLKAKPAVQAELPLTPGEHLGPGAEFENMTEVEGPKMAPVRPSNPQAGIPTGLKTAPEEVQVEPVSEPAQDIQGVNKSAKEFTEGLEKEPETVKDIKDASHRQAIHALGDPDNAMEFYNQKDGPAALAKLKGLSHEDLAGYIEEKTGIVTDKSALSRAGKTAGSAGKRIGVKMLLDKVSPSEVLSDLGAQ